MKTGLSWLTRDTIAGRFGMTIAAAMGVTGVLIGLFFAFGGVWAQPPMDAEARLDGAGTTIRMVETAPLDLRPALAKAASTRIYTAEWLPADHPLAVWLSSVDPATNEAQQSQEVVDFARELRRPVLIFSQASIPTIPDFPLSRMEPDHGYYFAGQLIDGSWLLFRGKNRYWGLSQLQRLVIWTFFLILSFAAVSAVTTRQLSRPFRQFARAVRQSGGNPQAPPIAAAGPQELRELIVAFNEMRTQIQDFVAYRTSMLAAISHDLRTPLTRMRLRGEFVTDATQQARLFRDVDEMQAMIEGALAFFRGDADEEAARPFDLPGILQTIADDFADQGIDIAYRGPARATLRGRPLALKRAFTNLVENAVKYATPPEITLQIGERSLSVTIRDKGPGIPAAALGEVFRPFYRLERSRNRTTGGTGLGLTAAQAIIRGHGGSVTLRNHPEGGLEVTVGLPHAV